MDEPLHVAAAVEWWRTGNILYPEQPPIARAFFAIWPQISGASYNLTAGISEAGTDIFHTGGNYWKNLALIRAGTLPFFFLAGLTLMAWARRYFDDRVMVATILLSLYKPSPDSGPWRARHCRSRLRLHLPAGPLPVPALS